MRQDYQDLVADLVRDTDSILSADQSDRALDLAISRYSEDKPLETVEDLIASADGTRIALPSAYVHGYSRILSVEYPVGETVPVIIKARVYVSPAGALMDLSTSVSTGDTLRITYTIRHTVTAVTDTITIEHLAGVSHFAAALLCAQLAAYYAHDTDTTIGADAVDHQSKSDKFASLARKYEAVYFRELGIDKNRKPGAAAIVDLDRNLSRGGDRIFHGRRYR